MFNPISFIKRLMPKQGSPSDERLWQPNASFFRSLFQSFNNPTLANINVNPENALAISAYWCGIRAISEDIAKLPVKMYRKNAQDDKEFIFNDALLTVLNLSFNDELDAMTGKQTMIFWLLGFGNAYAEISYNKAKEIELHLIHPTRVQPRRNPETQDIEYCVESTTEADRKIGKKNIVTLQKHEILHLKGAVGNGYVGYSLAEIAAESLGISIAAENFTGSFFGNNLNVGAILETPGKLTPDLKEETRKEWKEQFRGSQSKEALAILPQNFKYQQIQMKSTDAELLKTREFQILEVARWLRIPPHKIMELMGAKFNNVEQQNIEYVTDCLGAWIKRLEVQFKFHFHRKDNVYIDIDEKVLLRGDEAARVAYYDKMMQMGAISPKEIAKAEGWDFTNASEEKYQPLNIQSTQLASENQALKNELLKKQILLADKELTAEPQEKASPEPEPMPEPEPQEIEEVEQDEMNQKGISPDACLALYMPVMSRGIELLVQKEYRAHESANKKEGYALTEHLNKFYSKFENELTDKLKMHVDYLCGIFGKESLQEDKLKELSVHFCNLEKSGDWVNERVESICQSLLNSCLEMSEAPKLGEILKDDSGKFYTLTLEGYKECHVTV